MTRETAVAAKLLLKKITYFESKLQDLVSSKKRKEEEPILKSPFDTDTDVETTTRNFTLKTKDFEIGLYKRELKKLNQELSNLK
jgi:hypothetical protein